MASVSSASDPGSPPPDKINFPSPSSPTSTVATGRLSENDENSSNQSPTSDTITLPSLMNIAGEIVNLDGAPNNSGRFNLSQFKANFTSNEDEIALLRKVFGIPTLRHRPTILTATGCSLTDQEGRVVRKVLKARVKHLETGRRMSRGFALASTEQKLRNYKALLARLDELIGAKDLQGCEPAATGTISFTLPKFGSLFKKKEDKVEKLLILILLLLLGVSPDTIRSQNIKQRLGTETIDKLLKALEGISRISSEEAVTQATQATQGTQTTQTVSSILGIPTSDIEAIASAFTQQDASYKTLIGEFAVLTEELNKASTRASQLEDEMKGKQDAITQLTTDLGTEKAKATQLQEQLTTALAPDEATLIEVREAIASLQGDDSTLTGEIARLEAERVKLNAELVDARKKISDAKQQSEEILEKIEEVLRRNGEKSKEQQRTIKTLLGEKQKLLEDKLALEKTLREKGADLEAVSAAASARTALEGEVKVLNEQVATENEQTRKATVVKDALAAAKAAAATKAAKAKAQDNKVGGGNGSDAIASATATITSVQDRLTVLRKLKSRPDRDREISRLQDQLLTLKGDSNKLSNTGFESFTSTLQQLLIQMALLDVEETESPTTESPTKESPTNESPTNNEPTKERLCLLLYFTDLFWDQIGTDLHLTEILLPDLEGKNVWPTIHRLGEILALLEGAPNSRVPVGNLSKLLDDISKEAASAPPDTLAALHDLRKRKPFLNASQKYFINKNNYFEVREGMTTTEFLQAPHLFLLEMSLLSRYNDYILKESPNRLECPSYQHNLGQQTE